MQSIHLISRIIGNFAKVLSTGAEIRFGSDHLIEIVPWAEDSPSARETDTGPGLRAVGMVALIWKTPVGSVGDG